MVELVASEARRGRNADRLSRFAGRLDALVEVEMDQIDVLPLTHRSWELRDNLSAYAAAYLAVAEELGCALLTSHARLARAGGTRCPVQLLGAERMVLRR